MDDTGQQLIEALDARMERRSERREFFRTALGAAAVAAAGAGAIGLATRAAAQAATDEDILNFALNLEYLEANFYHFAVFGTPIDSMYTSGTTGQQGQATGGSKVAFRDPAVAAYAKEIAQDELNHVMFLRGALGSAAVAQPAIDLSATASGAFSKAAQAATVVAPGQAFNPYASDENFLIAAFIFEDVGVTAYKGAAKLLQSKVYLEAAAGILAVEAYHASIVRTSLYAMGTDAQMITDKISNARDALDGAPAVNLATGVGPDDDQGTSPTGSGDTLTSNIAPLNSNGLAYSRTPQQVHNIVYLTDAAAPKGGFFPNGTNGTFTTSGDASTY